MVATVTASSSTSDVSLFSQKMKDSQIIKTAEGGIAWGKVYLEDTYIPSYDLNGTDSSYYADNWNNTDFCMLGINADNLQSFTQDIKWMAIQDYNRQNPDTQIHFAEQSSSIQKYLNNIDFKKEYGEYKQSRGCSSDEELTALNRVRFNTKENFINFTSGLIGSINLDKYGPIASQIARNSDLNNLVDFFCEFGACRGDQNKQELALEKLMEITAKNEPTPEEQAKAMKERYNSSLISKYAS